MSSRDRGPGASHLRYLAMLAAVGVVTAVGFYLLASHPDRGARLSADGSTLAPSSHPASQPPSPTTRRSSAGSSRPASPDGAGATVRSHAPAVHTAASADAAIAKLVAGQHKGSVSVAAYNPKTGLRYSYGTSGGMTVASVFKLNILEVVLLRHEQRGQPLSAAEDAHATAMIESSDNDSADWLFANSAGAVSGIVKANKELGLHCTVLGSGYIWGLSTTCAADQVTLLKHLTDPHGPLDAASRTYALGLLKNVESDQRWGVGAAADPGTSFVNKNGWLGVDDDGGLWAVNSDGIITVNGQQVLISVLTQHDSAFQPGVTLNEAIAKIVAPVVAR